MNCLYPPMDVNSDNLQYKLEDLLFDSIEYQYCAMKFGTTFNGRNSSVKSIKQCLRVLKQGNKIPELFRIVRIQKLYNHSIYNRIEGEFKRLLTKYKNKKSHELALHLFHGTKYTKPE